LTVGVDSERGIKAALATLPIPSAFGASLDFHATPLSAGVCQKAF